MNLTILGATGSVGKSTLDVARRHPQRFRIHALTARRDVAGLAALCREFKPKVAVIGDAASAEALRKELGSGIAVRHGEDALCEVAGDPAADAVMSSIVGAAGLTPTLAAVRAGKRVLIANKEPLVMAGALLLAECAKSGATIVPIDSEHNAIFQCLPGGFRCGKADPGVRSLVLTASGGPFRDLPLAELAAVTPAQAVRHPNWVMGPKISVDSATMMNKGLELIEAHHLFGMAQEQIQVVLHPESVVHSLVEYVDGSMLAQLGQPDMRVPIAHALAFPERIESGVGGLSLADIGKLNFRSVEARRYPALGLARDALRAGGILPNVLNAANEVAVDAFLSGRTAFTRIAEIIEGALAAAPGARLPSGGTLGEILEVDTWARRAAAGLIEPARRAVGHA
jgi:1-deoxy-D-xylulose-5-phosphate reductoisomerase